MGEVGDTKFGVDVRMGGDGNGFYRYDLHPGPDYRAIAAGVASPSSALDPWITAFGFDLVRDGETEDLNTAAPKVHFTPAGTDVPVVTFAVLEQEGHRWFDGALEEIWDRFTSLVELGY